MAVTPKPSKTMKEHAEARLTERGTVTIDDEVVYDGEAEDLGVKSTVGTKQPAKKD